MAQVPVSPLAMRHLLSYLTSLGVRLPLAPISARGASVSANVKPTSAKRPLSNRLLTPPPTADDEYNVDRPPSSLDEVENDLYDDDDEDAVPNPSPIKNKGKARARKQILSSDEEDDEDEFGSKPPVSRALPYASPIIASPAGKVRGTPRDVSDLFSPSVKKTRVAVKRTPVHNDDTEEEEEHDENVAPSTLRLAVSRSAKAISKSSAPLPL
jgi:hypothetical protein